MLVSCCCTFLLYALCIALQTDRESILLIYFFFAWLGDSIFVRVATQFVVLLQHCIKNCPSSARFSSLSESLEQASAKNIGMSN